ncbi:hypothetical protein HDU67_006466 [Dinochytrium kinnereticum]|nr:hypothetical protein HDU67_006466 [Dinochytrium kinnereticum]
MPTADYEISGVHTAHQRPLMDRLENFSRSVGENITGVPAGGGPSYGSRPTSYPSGRGWRESKGGTDLSEAYTRLPHDPREALHYPSADQVRHKAPTYERRHAILEQPPLFLRLLAAYKAFAEGKVPTNDQLEEMINAVAQARKVRGVSPDGVECLKALDSLLQTVKIIIRERNQDEAIQRFFYHLRMATSPMASQATGTASASSHMAREAMSKLLILGKSLILNTDPYFRGSMKGMNELFRELISAAKEEGVPVESPTKALADVSGRIRGEVKGYIEETKGWAEEGEQEEEGEEEKQKEEEEEEVPLKSTRRTKREERPKVEEKPTIHAHARVKKQQEAPEKAEKRRKAAPTRPSAPIPGKQALRRPSTSGASTSSAPAEMEAPSPRKAQGPTTSKPRTTPRMAKYMPRTEGVSDWGTEPFMAEEGEETGQDMAVGIAVEAVVTETTAADLREDIVSIEQERGMGIPSSSEMRSRRGKTAERVPESTGKASRSTARGPEADEPIDILMVVDVGGPLQEEQLGAEEFSPAEEEIYDEWNRPIELGGRLGKVTEEPEEEEWREQEETEDEEESVVSVSTTTSSESSAVQSIERQLKTKLHPSKAARTRTEEVESSKPRRATPSRPSAKGKEVARREEGKEVARREESKERGFLGKMALVTQKKLMPTKGEEEEVDVEAIVDRFVEIIRKLHTPEMADTRDAMSGLLGLVSGFEGRALPWDPHMDVAMRELEMLLSRFANNRPIEPLLTAIKSLSSKLTHSEKLRHLWSDAYDLLRRSFSSDTRYIKSSDFPGRVRGVAYRIREHVVEEGLGPYETDLKIILREINGLVNDLSSDALSRRLGEDMTRMRNALFIDSSTGRPTFKTPLVMDITHVIIPMLWEDIKFIPIPRVEHKSRDWHIVVEDIVLTTENVVPNLMEVKMKNSVLFGLRPEVGTAMDHSLSLNFFQIQADVRDMPFFFRKKTGFPQMTDWGVANFHIGGEGITVRTKIGLDLESSQTTIYPQKVVVSVENLNLEIIASRNDALYRVLHSTIIGILRREIAALVGKQVLQIIAMADEKITPWKMKYLQSLKSQGGMSKSGLEMVTSGGGSAMTKTSKFFDDVMKSGAAKGLVDKVGSVAKEMMG